MSKRWLCLVFFAFTFVLAISRSSAHSAWAQSPEVSIHDLKLALWAEDEPFATLIPTSVVGEDQALPLSAAGLADWSRIAFQSFRDENWEIYLARGDGSQPTRFTTDPHSDVRPRLNRGATRLAFASNRDENWEIYAKNTDGSGLTRLTFNDASDTSPFWSPDGSRIAFISSRDGNWEIYIMNADGSGPVRLTFDAADDVAPAWSPDGQRIAWLRRGNPGSVIWTMDVAGGNAALVTDPLAYAQNPVWSPDSTRLAFDYDADGDNLNELAIVNADGSNLQTVYDANSNLTDAWMGSWSPDGSWLLFSYVKYVIDQNQLYLDHTYIYQTPAVGGGATRLAASGYDLTPDWQTMDIAPPQSKMQPLDRYLRTDRVCLQWSGIDEGPAGINGYDVQYREAGNQAWTEWLSGFAGTAAYFSGDSNHTYSFRVRATDQAHNVGEWSSNNVFTTLYAWMIEGKVYDHTEMPVKNAAITITPGGTDSRASDASGRYHIYVAEEADAYRVDWRKPGYGNLPAAKLDHSQDARLEIALPPVDNQASNGDFENGFGDEWQTYGMTMPALTTTHQHTGASAATLGSPQLSFASPVDLAGSNFAEHPQLVVEEDGEVHALWSGDRYGQPGIYYARRLPNGAWSTPQKIPGIGYSYQLHLAEDANGAIHIVWSDDAGAHYVCRTPGGEWSDFHDFPSGYDPELAIDTSGVVHILYRHLNGYIADAVEYAQRAPDGVWSTPLTLFTCSRNGINAVHIVLDANGVVHAMWSFFPSLYHTWLGADGKWITPYIISNNSEGATQLHLLPGKDGSLHVVWKSAYYPVGFYYAKRSSTGDWSTSEHVAHDMSDSYEPQLAIDGNGIVHLVWMSGQPYHVYYTRRSLLGIWSDPECIYDDDASSPPRLLISPSNKVYIVWGGGFSGQKIYYTTQQAGGGWTAPQKIADARSYFHNSQVVLKGEFDFHIAWQSYNAGSGTIFYIGPESLKQTGDSGLRQMITLPVTMTQPVLSFFYQLHGASATSGSWFDVSIDDGDQQTALITAKSSLDDWTHRWFDLSSWAGEKITVSFSVHQTAGGARTQAYLDDVTIGSARPDVWVAKHGATALPGDLLVQTITYGNQGNAIASQVSLTDVLPAGQFFVAASPSPVFRTLFMGWQWQLGDLPPKSKAFTIILTTTIAPTVTRFSRLTSVATIKTTSAELELENNKTFADVFVGHRVYLPRIMKAE